MSDKPVDAKGGEAKGETRAKSEAAGAKTAGGAAPAAVKPKSSSPLPLIAVGVLALALGGAAGVFLVAPKVVAARDEAAAHPAPKADPAKEKDKKKGGKESEPVIHKVDNLIVNPAGAEGRRFIMTSVAIEVPNAKLEQALRSKDPMLRDAIIGALEREPIRLITAPGGRDSVRAAIAAVVAPMIPDAEWIHVYLPQFVIQ